MGSRVIANEIPDTILQRTMGARILRPGFIRRLCNNIELQTIVDELREAISAMLIMTRRNHRKMDPFLLIVLLVALGTCVTIGYQFVIYSGTADAPIAREVPRPFPFGG